MLKLLNFFGFYSELQIINAHHHVEKERHKLRLEMYEEAVKLLFYTNDKDRDTKEYILQSSIVLSYLSAPNTFNDFRIQLTKIKKKQ